MNSTIASEIWGELRRFVNTVDRQEAADTLVSILIDNDEDPDDIKSAFVGDPEIKIALSNYLTEDIDEYDEEEDDNEYDEDQY